MRTLSPILTLPIIAELIPIHTQLPIIRAPFLFPRFSLPMTTPLCYITVFTYNRFRIDCNSISMPNVESFSCFGFITYF